MKHIFLLFSICLLFLILLLPKVMPSIVKGDTDCGVEWVNDYPICGYNTCTGRDDTAVGFYNMMIANGFTGRFNCGNSAAQASDFTDRNVVGWGDDHNWVDTVDICYQADHGNIGVFGFGGPQNKCIVSARDCQWGDDYDLEWIILDDCSCLRQGHYGVWWPTFKKLHMIIGFDTNAHDGSSRGTFFAQKLVSGWSVQQAWWYACEQTEGSGTYAAIAGACSGDTSIYNEQVWGFGHVAPDPLPLAWWWWVNHGC